MSYVITDINYNTDASLVRELVGEHRTVVIKNKVPLAPETIIEFYKSIGNVVKQNKKVKLFIQVNIGNEDQKSGVNKNELHNLYNYCRKLNLDVIGLMCIPPFNKDPEKYFKETNLLKNELNLLELSMGMSSDYIKAIRNSSTYLRIGSNIFGKRS